MWTSQLCITYLQKWYARSDIVATDTEPTLDACWLLISLLIMNLSLCRI